MATCYTRTIDLYDWFHRNMGEYLCNSKFYLPQIQYMDYSIFPHIKLILFPGVSKCKSSEDSLYASHCRTGVKHWIKITIIIYIASHIVVRWIIEDTQYRFKKMCFSPSLLSALLISQIIPLHTFGGHKLQRQLSSTGYNTRCLSHSGILIPKAKRGKFICTAPQGLWLFTHFPGYMRTGLNKASGQWHAMRLRPVSTNLAP